MTILWESLRITATPAVLPWTSQTSISSQKFYPIITITESKSILVIFSKCLHLLHLISPNINHLKIAASYPVPPKITAHNLCLKVPDSWYWIVLTIAEDWKILRLKVFFSTLCSLFCCELSMPVLSTTQKFGVSWTCSRTVKLLQHPYGNSLRIVNIIHWRTPVSTSLSYH